MKKCRHTSHILTTPNGNVAHVLCNPKMDQKQIEALGAIVDAVYENRVPVSKVEQIKFGSGSGTEAASQN